MKRRLCATGKCIWINALMVPVKMAAISGPRAAVEAEAVMEEETSIGARLLGCSLWETSGYTFESTKTADGIQPIPLGFILHGCRTSLLLISP